MAFGRKASKVKYSKYKNKPVELDGIKFASRRERNRFSELKILQRAGHISKLTAHPKFVLLVDGGSFVGTYTPDSLYFENGELIIEDVKSPATQKNSLYRWKKRHMKGQFGITIREIF